MAQKKLVWRTILAEWTCAKVQVVVKVRDENGDGLVDKLIETSVGRVIFNEQVPRLGFVNELIGKKSLRKIIGDVIKECGIAKTA